MCYNPLPAMQLVSPVSPVDDAVQYTPGFNRQVSINYRPLGQDLCTAISARHFRPLIREDTGHTRQCVGEAVCILDNADEQPSRRQARFASDKQWPRGHYQGEPTQGELDLHHAMGSGSRWLLPRYGRNAD